MYFLIYFSDLYTEWNGILKGRFLSDLAHVTVLRAQQVYNTNSYLEDVIYFLDEINMQFQPWINYAIANSWNLILKMKVEIPSLKFNFINGLVKRWNLNFKYNCSIWSKRNQLALRKNWEKSSAHNNPPNILNCQPLAQFTNFDPFQPNFYLLQSKIWSFNRSNFHVNTKTF